MRIFLTASGRPARLLDKAPAVTPIATGEFETSCEPGTTLHALMVALELDSHTVMVIVDNTSIAPDARADLVLTEGMRVALVPPIRAG